MITDEFINHPIIQKLKNNKRWTINHKDSKKPLDIVELDLIYHGLLQKSKLKGACFTDERSLKSMDDVLKLLMEINNIENTALIPTLTYYFSTIEDNLMLLDIEPTCPQKLKEKLLKLPFLYGEVSTSGKGYHLIFEVTEEYKENLILADKVALKEKNKYYEVLQEHYVTFTGNMIERTDEETDFTFENLYKELAKEVKDITIKNIEISDEAPNIYIKDRIKEKVLEYEYKKTLSDFKDDYSSFEYGCMSFYQNKVRKYMKRLNNVVDEENKYDEEQVIYLTYEIVKELIPYRDKHDEYRYGMPWLLYLSHNIASKSSFTL